MREYDHLTKLMIRGTFDKGQEVIKLVSLTSHFGKRGEEKERNKELVVQDADFMLDKML